MSWLTSFFRTTETELRAHYPTWRVPLERPVPKMIHNPFTGQKAERLSWDPDPEATADEEDGDGGFPHVDMQGLQPEHMAALLKVGHDSSRASAERFLGGALIGPEEGPSIFEVPSSFVRTLAELDASSAKALAAAWDAAHRSEIADCTTAPDTLAKDLDDLRAFARETMTANQRMYMRFG